MKVSAILMDTAHVMAHFAEWRHDSYPGLWNLQGRPLVAYVTEALRACPYVEAIGMLLPVAYQGTKWGKEAEVFLPARRGGLVEQLLEMLHRLGKPQRCILFPANAPLVRGEMFTTFLEAVPRSSVLAYAVHRKERVEERFPFPRSWPDKRFQEGEVVASRLCFFRPEVLETHAELLEGLLGGRVPYLRLLGQLGPAFALRLQRGKVGLADLARKVSEIVGGHCTVILSRHPELAFVVESEQDLRWAQEALEAH